MKKSVDIFMDMAMLPYILKLSNKSYSVPDTWYRRIIKQLKLGSNGSK